MGDRESAQPGRAQAALHPKKSFIGSIRFATKVLDQHLVDRGESYEQAVGLLGSQGFFRVSIGLVKAVAVESVESRCHEDALKGIGISPAADFRKGFLQQPARGFEVATVSFECT